MDKRNIGKEGGAFKIDEDGTILRIEKGVDYQKCHRVITICLITLFGLRELIRQSFWWNDMDEYLTYFNWLSYVAMFVTVVILILLCTSKVKKPFGFVSLLVGTYLILCTSPYVIIMGYYLNRVCSLIGFAIIVIAIIYVSKISLLTKSTNI
jgi:hypothetical protein